METSHNINFKNSSNMVDTESESVDLLITSPPYPMIEMWDELFSSMNEDIKLALEEENSKLAFNLMHEELNKIWKESVRVMKQGGVVCINIGDATRTINKNFQLFPNHVRITDFFQKNGFIVLPSILWRKPTNSPTKFMGSGMLPPNAYVTLEHEYLLIFRKGEKKRKIPPKSEFRYNSAYFWEERNKWFSDTWVDVKGIKQNLVNNRKLRERSAAYPLELPYRLINMFSMYGDTVLDPFWGTGTTSIAAMILARNSIGYEINPEFLELFTKNLKNVKELTESINLERFEKHVEFIKRYKKEKKEPKYTATNYDFPVITGQEVGIKFYKKDKIIEEDKNYKVIYNKFERESKTKVV